MSGAISTSRANGVATLRLTRPEKRNALDRAMYRALSAALIEGEASSGVAVHVLVGSEGVFTAGNDIADFLAGGGDADRLADILAFVRLLPRLEKPLIAGVDGPAVGIGTTLLMHCDLVYASDRASFSTPFLALGLVPEAASSLLMPLRMGYARAFEMLALGATFSAERMCEAGVVNAVVPVESLEATVAEAARALAAKPPTALAAARRLMRGDVEAVAAHSEAEARVFAERLRSPEAAEAFRAFMEKRAPDFSRAGSG
ncbi:MAG: enoyl-CoA hydratase-related protein [Pseudomonadota bacterium]